MDEYCMVVKILFEVNGNTINKLLRVLNTIKGNVFLMKENDLRRVKNSIIGILSLNLHRFENLCIVTDSNETDLENIKKQISMID